MSGASASVLARSDLRISLRLALGRQSLALRIALLTLVVGHVYYAHRWLFRYSDTSTSPTYEATPVGWQAAKYPIVLGLGLLAWTIVGLNPRVYKPLRNGGFARAVGLLTFSTLVASLAAIRTDPATGAALLKPTFFLPVILVLIVTYRGFATVKALTTVLGWLVSYHLLFSMVQLVAWRWYGRLPNLAYERFVRFGGGLDDPNGLGIFLVLPLLLLLSASRGRRLVIGEWLTAMVCFGLLLLTVSFSAFGALGIGVACYLGLTRQSVTATKMALLGSAVVGLVVASGVGEFWLESKRQSISSRLSLEAAKAASDRPSAADFLRDAGLRGWLFGDGGVGYHNENSFIAWTMDYGVLSTVILLFVCLATIQRGVRRVRRLRVSARAPEASFFAALTAYATAFLASATVVPQFTVFPSNTIFWIVATLIWLPAPGGLSKPSDRSTAAVQPSTQPDRECSNESVRW